MAEDAFKDYYGDSDILEPLYTPEQLARLTEESDILQQLIDAYKTNIVGFGVNVESDVDYEKLPDAAKKPIDAEKIKMENLIKYCNFDESFSSVMKKSSLTVKASVMGVSKWLKIIWVNPQVLHMSQLTRCECARNRTNRWKCHGKLRTITGTKLNPR